MGSTAQGKSSTELVDPDKMRWFRSGDLVFSHDIFSLQGIHQAPSLMAETMCGSGQSTCRAECQPQEAQPLRPMSLSAATVPASCLCRRRKTSPPYSNCLGHM